jgi:cobalt/nickel transport system permease protein
VHRIDPRIKFVAMIGCVLLIVTTPPGAYWSFLLYALFLFILHSISRVPLTYVAKRLLVVAPFILLIAAFIPFVKKGDVAGSFWLGDWKFSVTYDGLLLFWGVLVKSCLSVLCMILLSSTTRFDILLKGLEELRCPRIIIMILSFMYRYLFLISDEFMRLLRAKSARGTGGRCWFELTTLSSIVGVMFVRSYERAERVYLAMCSRGFDGTVIQNRPLAIGGGDILFLIAVASCFAIARCAGGA